MKDSKYKKVGISADKTQKERDDDRALRQELADRKRRGERVVLFRGKVMTVEEREAVRAGNLGEMGRGGGVFRGRRGG